MKKKVLTGVIVATSVLSPFAGITPESYAQTEQSVTKCTYSMKFKGNLAQDALDAFRKFGRVAYGIEDMPSVDAAQLTTDADKEAWDKVSKLVSKAREKNKKLHETVPQHRIDSAIESFARIMTMDYLSQKIVSGSQYTSHFDPVYSHIMYRMQDDLNTIEDYDVIVSVFSQKPINKFTNVDKKDLEEALKDLKTIINKTGSIVDEEKIQHHKKQALTDTDFAISVAESLADFFVRNHEESGDFYSREILLNRLTNLSDGQLPYVYAIVNGSSIDNVYKDDPKELVYNDPQGRTPDEVLSAMREDVIRKARENDEILRLAAGIQSMDRNFNIFQSESINKAIYNIYESYEQNMSFAIDELFGPQKYRDNFEEYQAALDSIEDIPTDNDGRRFSLLLFLATALDTYNDYEEDCLPTPTPTTVTEIVTSSTTEPTTVVTTVSTTIPGDNTTVTTNIPTTITSSVTTGTTVSTAVTSNVGVTTTREVPTTMQTHIPTTVEVPTTVVQPPVMIQDQVEAVGPTVHTGGSVKQSLIARLVALLR